VHEFQESTPAVDGSGPVTTYKLAIGDRVNKVDDNEFMLVQTGVTITREPQTVSAS